MFWCGAYDALRVCFAFLRTSGLKKPARFKFGFFKRGFTFLRVQFAAAYAAQPLDNQIDIEKLKAPSRSQKAAGGRFSRMLYAKQNNALHMLTIQPFIAPVQYFCYDEV